jgi:UDP-N-acetylglucosamine--N-acetylmuramyl-(pentapeptide) pyrophosphoryl-undecaprenol N-acetylglucosamine transferase
LIVVTGGGLGARTINRAVVTVAPQLVEHASIYHITGTAAYDDVTAHAPELIDYQIVPFISTGMAPVLGAADIVVSRVGATTMQELAALAKAVVMVPNPYLTGGQVLRRALDGLLADAARRQALGKALHAFARPDAALDMATLIVDAATAHIHEDTKPS